MCYSLVVLASRAAGLQRFLYRVTALYRLAYCRYLPWWDARVHRLFDQARSSLPAAAGFGWRGLRCIQIALHRVMVTIPKCAMPFLFQSLDG